MSEHFSAEEEKALREALRRAAPLVCPRCTGPILSTPIHPPPGVPYVRSRILLQCSSCGRRAAVDRKPTR